MSGVRIGIKDYFLCAIVRSWPLWIRILLCFSAILANYRLINIWTKNPPSNYTPSLVDYLFDLNIGYGGLLILIFFLIWKNGTIAEFILARPEDGPRSGIGTVRVQLVLYALSITVLALVYQYFFHFSRGVGNLILWSYFWDFFLGCFITTISEEVQYRFVLFYTLNSFFGRVAATLLSAVLFAVGHNYSLPGLIYVGLVGLAASFLTMRHGTLWPAILFHAMVNIGFKFQEAAYFYKILPSF